MAKAPIHRPTEAGLLATAQRHLARFEASSADLRRVLARHTLPAVRAGLIEVEEAEALIAVVVARCQSLGHVDDQRFARLRAAGSRARGSSARAIGARLRRSGIDRGGVSSALAAADAGHESAAAAEAAAAQAYARRRRLGPHAPQPQTEDATAAAARLRRALAALSRAGFAPAAARAALGLSGDEDPP